MDRDGRDNPLWSLLEVGEKEVEDVLVNPVNQTVREEA
jgi:hypothetical protein